MTKIDEALSDLRASTVSATGDIFQMISIYRPGEVSSNTRASVLATVCLHGSIAELRLSEQHLTTLGESLGEHLYAQVSMLLTENLEKLEESEPGPEGKCCGNCGRELNKHNGQVVEGRGWYCDNCAERYTDNKEEGE